MTDKLKNWYAKCEADGLANKIKNDKNFNKHFIKPSQMIAVIGPTGAGKTTAVKLGLNTSNATPTANNFTQQILPVLSTTQVQSISYSFYLSNTSVATYHIVFATGASFGASSVTGFTASYIRIA